MKLTRPAAPPDAGAQASHVLHWVPGYVTSSGCGSWELQDAAAYDNRAPGYGSPVCHAARDAAEAALAQWVAGQVGHAVGLELAYATVTSLGVCPPCVHVAKEPVYFIRPATEEVPA